MEQRQESNQQPGKTLPLGLSLPLLITGVVVVIVGVLTGYVLSRVGLGGGRLEKGKIEVAPGAKVTGQEVGLEDTKTFRDTATGVLRKGGVEGEGTHYLEREGGSSQNAYLTSSVVDLDEFVDKRVEVWGETFKAQKVGWLMDVGKIKIVE